MTGEAAGERGSASGSAEVGRPPARRVRRPLEPDLAALRSTAPGTPVERLPDDPEGLAQLTRQIRRLRALTAGGVMDADLHAEAAHVAAIADRLEAASAGPDERLRVQWEGDYVSSDPLVGRFNVLAPPVEFEALPDGTLRGEAVFGLEYQGPPATVHGGFLALMLDVALGRANHLAGVGGMTVYLDVDYVAAAPILQPLVVTGRMREAEGRKIWSEGAVHHGDTLCARAEALFLVPRGNVPEYE